MSKKTAAKKPLTHEQKLAKLRRRNTLRRVTDIGKTVVYSSLAYGLAIGGLLYLQNKYLPSEEA